MDIADWRRQIDEVDRRLVELLNQRWSSVYTWPQTTHLQLAMLQANAKWTPTDTLTLQGNAYLRSYRASHVDGNGSNAQPCDPAIDPALAGQLCIGDGGTPINQVSDNRVLIQPAFTWRPSADTSLTLLGLFQRDVNGVGTQFLPTQGTLFFNPNGMLAPNAFLGDPNRNSFTRNQWWAGYLFEHRFNDAITVRQNLRYASVDTNLQAVIGTGLQANLRTLNRVSYAVPEAAQNLTVDTNALIKFSTGPLSHTTLVGFDYLFSNSQTKLGIGPAPPLDIFNPVYGLQILPPTITSASNQRQNQYGVYLQDQIAFEKWRLTLSGRHDWVDTTTDTFFTNTQSYQAVRAFSGRAGLNYVFDFGLSPYVSYANSFLPTLGTNFNGQPFLPSTSYQYEVGVKYQPPGTNLSATAAAYKLVQQNTLTVDPQHPTFSVQTGQVTVQGLEFGFTASLARGMNIIGAYTYTDAKITQSNGTDVGNQVAVVPPHQGSLWSDFTVQEGLLRGLGFGAGIRYVGTNYGNSANTLLIPGFALVDALLSYDLGELNPKMQGAKLALNATNVMNTQYVTTCSGPAGCFYGQERFITLTMRYNW